jgi:hypothetical protein
MWRGGEEMTDKSKVDIVERLRMGEGTSPDHKLLLEAAAVIESLRRKIEEAKK